MHFVFFTLITFSANSALEQNPSFVIWYIPYLLVKIISQIAFDRSNVYVGLPTWSSTTFIKSLFSDSLPIVFMKFSPFSPKSQDVLIIKYFCNNFSIANSA